MNKLSIHAICCDDTPEQHSKLVVVEVDSTVVDSMVVDTIEQEVEANSQRDLHNAAHHEEHGPVTYLQEIHSGGFAVTFGNPDRLQEKFFGPGSWVAFMDDQGPGHGSKVGPEGVKRTLRVLKGHLPVE